VLLANRILLFVDRFSKFLISFVEAQKKQYFGPKYGWGALIRAGVLKGLNTVFAVVQKISDSLLFVFVSLYREE